jgi:hypothetical protein
MCEGARHSSSLGRRPVRQHDRPAEGPSPGSAVSGCATEDNPRPDHRMPLELDAQSFQEGVAL